MRGFNVIPLTWPSLGTRTPVLAHTLLIFTARVLMGHQGWVMLVSSPFWSSSLCLSSILRHLTLPTPSPPAYEAGIRKGLWIRKSPWWFSGLHNEPFWPQTWESCERPRKPPLKRRGIRYNPPLDTKRKYGTIKSHHVKHADKWKKDT